ncbi:MAG: hypothetical protein OXC68_14650 [Aestuariivita sp.]|nr:hypothetical protein [Aestuariivita sp.]
MADIAGLRAFSEIQERDEAPFFTGRDAYITHIQKACANALTKITYRQSITSATRLFYGAPGAGKTSLLNEIAKRSARRDFGDINPLVVRLASEKSLNNEDDIVLQIAETLGKDRVFRTTVHSDTSVNAAIPAIGSGGVTKGHVQDPPAATFFNLKHIYKDIVPKCPILLCIDEIQNIGPKASEMMSLLHQGEHGLPIIPIYAGLGNSLNVMMDHGISRPVDGYIHSVGALAKDEARTAVTEMLTRFEVDQNGAMIDWPDTLAERSDSWPQHLHNAMRALALELIRPEVNGNLKQVDTAAVFNQEERMRMRAYRWRVSEMLSDHRELTAQVMHHVVTSDLTRPEVKTIIEDVHEKTPHKLPANMTVDSFFDHLAHRGLLQEFDQQDADGKIRDVIRCPIPSLATYIMERGGVDPSYDPVVLASKPPTKNNDENAF